MLVPLAFLLLAELGLRLAGFGYRTAFFKPVTVQGEDCLVANWDFGRRFFPAQLARAPAPSTMKAEKAKGSIRVFVFGESAAQGDPRPHFGASRYLKVLLSERLPGQDFEVVNTSMTAINSHVILPIAREAARHKGDIWIIYMGNNEMVGPFGAATVFGSRAAPLSLVRLNLAIQEWRTGQFLASLRDRLPKRSAEPSQWDGMKMFTQNEVAPDDPSRGRVYENFRHNLDEILEAGASSGAKVILSTVAVNLRDCPPFASVRTIATPQNQQGYDQALAEAAAAVGRGEPAEAARRYRKALELLPQSADAHFRLGETLAALGDRPEAQRHFELARDYDTLPFRTDSRLNEGIARAAERFAPRGIVLCDAVQAFAASAPAGAPGHEAFFEHVHFTPEGNYRLGLAWAERVAELLPEAARSKAATGWATPEQCARLLGLTEWNRASILQEVTERMSQPPLSAQVNNPARVAALKEQVRALRQKTQTGSTSEYRAAYEDAVKRSPNDYLLREAFAEFLDATGARQEAIVQRTKTRDLTPSYYFSHLNLGIALREDRRYADAEQVLLQAAELGPEQVEVRLQLGSVYGLQKKYEAALGEFARAARIDPTDPRPLHFAGEVLWRTNQREESIAKLRAALQRQPLYADARYRLGEELVQLGDITGAADELEELIRLKPDHLKGRLNLAVAYAKMGRFDHALKQAEEVLRLDPQNQAATQLQEQLRLDLSNRGPRSPNKPR